MAAAGDCVPHDQSFIIHTGPTNSSIPESLDTVWSALHAFREGGIPESDPTYDKQWDDICTAMAWVTEALER